MANKTRSRKRAKQRNRRGVAGGSRWSNSQTQGTRYPISQAAADRSRSADGASPAVMGFGKFQGESVASVPSSYLLWCYETFASPEPYVVGELQRRGLIPAGGYLERCLESKPGKSLGQRPVGKRCSFLNEKKGKSSQLPLGAGSSFERDVAAARGHGSVRVQSQFLEGADYRVKRADWIEAGGNERDCPF